MVAMECAWSIKREIKDEILDDNEQFDSNVSIIQNVKDELEFEEDFGNYEYATVTDEHDEDFKTEQIQPKVARNSYSAQRADDFNDYDDDDDDDEEDEDEDGDVNQFHAEHENRIYVDGEPEIYVDAISDSNCSKENASDPLAIDINVLQPSINHHPKAILNSTHTPIAPATRKILIRRRRLPPAPAPAPEPPLSPPSISPIASFKRQRPMGRPRKLPSVYRRREPPPANELFKKTYSLKHRLANKTTDCNTCHVCARTFYYPAEFEAHRRRCFFSCKKCSLIFQTALQLKAHHSKCIIPTNPRNLKKTSYKNDTASLSLAPTPSSSSSLALLAFENKNGHMISCHMCCTTFSSKKDLDLHRKQSHFVKSLFACHKCEQRFDSNDAAVLHLKLYH